MLQSLFAGKMEVSEPVERIVVAKPVASRPACSSSRPFSEQHVGAVQSSPSPPTNTTTTTSASEAIVPIKPKTTRLKPSCSQTNPGVKLHRLSFINL